MPRNGVVIIGNYGATNVGDEAVLSGLLTLAASRGKKPVTVMSYDPSRTMAEHGCASVPLLPFGIRSFLRFDYLRSFHILTRTEEVWIGGGALFTDEKLFAIFLWGWHAFWSRLLCGQVALVANTVGPIRTNRGKLLMRMILRMIRSATLRDSESEAVLRSLGFTGRATVATDPAFLIEPVARKADGTKTIIVSLRPWIREAAGLFAGLAQWIGEMTEQGYRVVLLPFQTMHDDDRTVLSSLYSLVQDNGSVELVEEAEDLQRIMQRIASAELVIGMRLHSLILSALHGTPFIGLSYSDKVANFCRSVGMGEYCLDLRTWHEEAFVRQTGKLLSSAEEIRRSLREKRCAMRQAALELSPEA